VGRGCVHGCCAGKCERDAHKPFVVLLVDAEEFGHEGLQLLASDVRRMNSQGRRLRRSNPAIENE
jgi:hypothetical protein